MTRTTPPGSLAPRAPFDPAVDAFCRALALGVPLVLTLLRVGPSPEWRDDVALVTSLGFVPVGGEGAPSAFVSQVASLLPLGGRVLRAGLVGAMGAGLVGVCLYTLARSLLVKGASTPRLTPLLALAAALTATLSPAFQHEATAAGGATLAAGLALSALLVRGGGAASAHAAAVGAGALTGLLVAENRVAALALVVALVVQSLGGLARPARAAVLTWLGTAAVVAAFCSIPALVRPLGEHPWIGLGVRFSLPTGLGQDVVRFGPLTAWSREMGPLALVFGLGGLCWSLARRSTREVALPLAALVAAGALVPAATSSPVAADRWAALSLLGIGSLAVLAAFFVQAAARSLSLLRIPLAEPAAVLLVVFHFTLVFSAAETSSDVVTPTTGLGAEVWTDEALGELPPSSLLVVRSPAVAFRLWAARVTRGERPDVVVVPLPLVGRSSVARDLLRDEPALTVLIRDVSMTGKVSEHALSSLAEARPLFVDLDPAWERRLFDHLRPTPLWLGFVPHTLGRSDRTRSITDSSGRRAFQRVLGVAGAAESRDPATLSVLSARAQEQAVVLAFLGDRDSARRVLGDLSRIDPESPFLARLDATLDGARAADPRELLE